MGTEGEFEGYIPEHEPNVNLGRQGAGPREERARGAKEGAGLAVASFILGLVSIPLSVIVIGAAVGLAGLILAIIHLKNYVSWRGLAVSGLVVSVVGMVLGVVVSVFVGIGVYEGISMMREMGSGQFEEYIGTVAPDMPMTDLDGNKITLSELKGKRVVLDFWATWCPPCKKEIPHFIELQRTIGSERLVIIGISNEPIETIRRFAEKEKINYRLVAISRDRLVEPYSRIVGIPTTFFIDEEGLIEDVISGYHWLDVLKAKALGEEKNEFE